MCCRKLPKKIRAADEFEDREIADVRKKMKNKCKFRTNSNKPYKNTCKPKQPKSDERFSDDTDEETKNKIRGARPKFVKDLKEYDGQRDKVNPNGWTIDDVSHANDARGWRTNDWRCTAKPKYSNKKAGLPTGQAKFFTYRPEAILKKAKKHYAKVEHNPLQRQDGFEYFDETSLPGYPGGRSGAEYFNPNLPPGKRATIKAGHEYFNEHLLPGYPGKRSEDEYFWPNLLPGYPGKKAHWTEQMDAMAAEQDYRANIPNMPPLHRLPTENEYMSDVEEGQ